MCYPVKAWVKSGRENIPLQALAEGTPGRGSLAGDLVMRALLHHQAARHHRFADVIANHKAVPSVSLSLIQNT